jgi:hypothetical protein
LVIRDDRLHPGLLEHELRDQDTIRLRMLPPGQISPLRGIPMEKRTLESPLLLGRVKNSWGQG